MVDRREWEEFRNTGMLWWINMILHTFGWALVYELSEGEITCVYPARVKFRGFTEHLNSLGYKKVSEYLKENSEILCKEAQEDD